MTKSSTRRIDLLFAAAIVTLAVAPMVGCAGYQLGHNGLYRRDIMTVNVPVFESESLRRHLGERLSEAVMKEIELTTPYKLAQGINADSVLFGRIVEDTKYVITENVNDEPRDIEVEMFVEATWHDRQGQPIFGTQRLAIPVALQELGQAVHFVPEGGQSLATAQQKAIERLAQQIVSQMEMPW